ncbi:hypothetical protein [Streptococcus pneumoniae]|uniref:hypothetical protein n=1 Tax=Streptococcus pneumoniae TaxID=1313 RepID=UPI001865A311|nr:hypothetical protein [Streptococcus pneumoniae]
MDRTAEVSSKHCFEVVDRTAEVSSKHGFGLQIELPKSVTIIHGKATLTWFEEIFKEYKLYFYNLNLVFTE